MLPHSHPKISRPAFLVVISHNILVVWIRILSKEPLDQISALLLVKFENHEESVDVSTVESYRVSHLCLLVLEAHEIVWHARRSSKF